MENKFIERFEKKVLNTIKKKNLFSKKHKILVACSGGKDSTTLLYVLKKYFPKQVEAVIVNVFIKGYSEKNLENLREFCKNNKIKLYEISLKEEFGFSLEEIMERLRKRGIKLNYCAVCGTLRRYLLNKYAKKLKADKIATGHNLDDEAQNILMNLLRNNLERMASIGIKTEKKSGFIQKIKPLYFCKEKEIEKYSRIKGFKVVYKRCPYAITYRAKIRDFLDYYEKKNKKIKENIVKFFLENKKRFKKYSTKGKIMKCKICGENSKYEVCSSCRIIMEVKKL